MGQEIERKFLVKGDAWRALGEGTLYRQGYLSTVKERTVRVRTINDRGYLTIKGVTRGVSRKEFEYEIPHADAIDMLENLCVQPLVEKRRVKIAKEGLIWEVDEFQGINAGLILAEVELEREQQAFNAPDWIGQEVSDDPRYFNANLIAHPFSTWSKD